MNLSRAVSNWMVIFSASVICRTSGGLAKTEETRTSASAHVGIVISIPDILPDEEITKSVLESELVDKARLDNGLSDHLVSEAQAIGRFAKERIPSGSIICAHQIQTEGYIPQSSESLSIRVSKAEISRLELLAKQKHMTVDEFVRRCVENALRVNQE